MYIGPFFDDRRFRRPISFSSPTTAASTQKASPDLSSGSTISARFGASRLIIRACTSASRTKLPISENVPRKAKRSAKSSAKPARGSQTASRGCSIPAKAGNTTPRLCAPAPYNPKRRLFPGLGPTFFLSWPHRRAYNTNDGWGLNGRSRSNSSFACYWRLNLESAAANIPLSHKKARVYLQQLYLGQLRQSVRCFADDAYGISAENPGV